MAYSIEEARELVIKAGLELSKAGLVARTWGNISARVSDKQYVITPSGRAYDTLTKEDIVLVNIEDGVYEGDVKPSGEKGVHAVVYEFCPDMNFVIHTHQNYASALSIIRQTIEVPDLEKSKLGNVIPCAEYGMYATEKLVNNIKEQIQQHSGCKSVLMKYHGALCFGKDYDEAFSVAYELEEVCKKEYERLCGFESLKDSVIRNCAESKEVLKAAEFQEKYEIPEQLESILAERDGIKSVLLVQAPFIKAVSNLGKIMYPYLDDLAQIAGTDVKCISACLNEKEVAQEEEFWNGIKISDLADALQDRNAVFIKGIGAICTGYDQSEAEAVGIVLEKACMAAYLAECVGNIPPLDEESARIDRGGYVNHYSKLK